MRIFAASNQFPLLLSLVGLCPVVAVVGVVDQRQLAVATQACATPPCTFNFGTPCTQVAIDYDFKDGQCCMTLADAADGGGGCTLSIAGGGDDVENGSCSYTDRLNVCTAGEKVPDGLSCVPGSAYAITGDWANLAGGTCPDSAYVLADSSGSSVATPLKMVLTGAATSWTDADVAAWQAATEAHTVAFFVANPQLAYTDVKTYTDLYSGDTIVDPTTNTVSLFYLQEISWRTTREGEIAGTMLLADAFITEEGKNAYLEALQASTSPTLQAVTAVSNLEVIEVVTVTPAPTTEAENSAGAPVATAPETPAPSAAPAPPPTPPEVVQAGVEISVGQGEQISAGATMAPTTSAGAAFPINSFGFKFVAVVALVVSHLVAL